MLTDLTPLLNLVSIGGELGVINNNLLPVLTGLDNIAGASISNLWIYNNPWLSECSIQSICDYLLSPGATSNIQDNASGCNSEQEVKSECVSVSAANTESSELMSIFPNPCSDFLRLYYTINKPGIIICDIFDISGTRVKGLVNENRKPGTYEMKANFGDLPAGVYFCTLKSGSCLQIRKIIKL